MMDYALAFAPYKSEPETLARDAEYKKIYRFVRGVDFRGRVSSLDDCKSSLRTAERGYKKVRQFQDFVDGLYPEGHPDREFQLRSAAGDLREAGRHLANAQWRVAQHAA